jgi:hemoglobin
MATIQIETRVSEYGDGDASYRAAGGVAGIERLVDDFYRVMDELPDARTIRNMHAENLDEARDKLARFLCGWLGGQNRYAEKYGSISIPGVHARFAIGTSERDAWLACMRAAVALQPYEPRFAGYLLDQLAIPAERVRLTSREPGPSARATGST